MREALETSIFFKFVKIFGCGLEDCLYNITYIKFGTLYHLTRPRTDASRQVNTYSKIKVFNQKTTCNYVLLKRILHTKSDLLFFMAKVGIFCRTLYVTV
jgi:hypothetical protein